MLRAALLGTSALLASAGSVSLATFDGAADTTTRQWREKNDPVMGGKSTGTFKVAGGVGVFDGEVVNVPFLQAPGFIQADTVDTKPFPDASQCKALELVVKSDNDYAGFRFSFSRAKAPGGKFFAFGYKAHFAPPVGEFGAVTIPFTNFTDFWDDATGEPVKTCQDNVLYCPDAQTLKNVQTMAVWAEGVAGKVHLEIKSITAVDCAEDLLV